MICTECKEPSGTSLVCAPCRKFLTPLQKKRLIIGWHNIIVEKARVGDIYECFHCGLFFPREKVCGDHYPHTKGAHPALRFDVNNGVCCCMRCNTSGSPFRKHT